MKKMRRPLILSAIIVLILASCALFPDTTTAEKTAQATPGLPTVVIIELVVQADTSIPFNTVGQVVKYNYNVRNAGGISTAGPVIVTGATCPEINTIGNKDNALDPNEILICTSTYTITQADLNKGSVTTISMASVNGINSNQVTTNVAMVQPVVLKLTKSASPVNFDKVGQIITYTYVITNSSAANLGPAQFTVTDSGLGSPINCGAGDLTLAPNATVTCSAAYTITQANMDSGSVVTNALASGGGAPSSQPSSVTVTKGTVVAPSNPSPANLTAGSTIQHQVRSGEWLWQIARCYGADPKAVVNANQPNPEKISPNTTVTVPNIGSAGKIYGPPCVGTHTVQTGETWVTIAQKYNADPTVLQMVNANSMSVGSVLNVPLNSANGSSSTVVVATTVAPTAASAANCIDITRTIKLANVNANLTHFNICGQTDATGKTRITTINIKQRPEDVGLGGLQLDISLPVETSTPLNDPNSLIVVDMNYDGNDDFRIVKNVPAGPNIPYVYYLYDPATRTYVYNEAFGKITSPEFPGNPEIRSKWRESAVKWGTDTYTISNNIPKLARRETWEALNETQAKHQIILFNADGSSQLSVDETVALPKQ